MENNEEIRNKKIESMGLFIFVLCTGIAVFAAGHKMGYEYYEKEHVCPVVDLDNKCSGSIKEGCDTCE